MKITIIAGGSRGDIQPFIALGAALSSAGYHVSMPAAPIFAELINQNGIEYIPANVIDPQVFVKKLDMDDAIESHNKLGSIIRMFGQIRPMMEEILNDNWDACKDCDAIISTGLPMGGLDIAEKLGVPCFHGLLLPLCPTRRFQSPFMPPLFNNAMYNRFSHILTEEAMWMMFRSIICSWRKRALGLGPRNVGGMLRGIYKGSVPVLAGFSDHVIPKPPEWPDIIKLTGYWFLDEPEGWTPPSGLEAFLHNGPPPVYIGFGSMVDQKTERMTALAIEALHLSGMRGIIDSGWNGMGTDSMPEFALRVNSIPHSWLFRHVAAVVHHGGAGTTAAVLRAGVPSIHIPFLGDQPFWGWRSYQLGVGPKPVPYNRLTAHRLAAMIRDSVHDSEMKNNAQILGNQIRHENGAQNAADIVRSYL